MVGILSLRKCGGIQQILSFCMYNVNLLVDDRHWHSVILAVYVVNMQCMFILCLFVQSPDRTESLSSSVNEGHSDTLPDDSVSVSSSITQPSIADTLTMSGSETTTRGSQVQFAHVLEKDCFMVFRSLCKLSMKSVTDIHDSKLVIFPYIWCIVLLSAPRHACIALGPLHFLHDYI